MTSGSFPTFESIGFLSSNVNVYSTDTCLPSAAVCAPLALLFLSPAQPDTAKATVRLAAVKKAAALFPNTRMLVSPFIKKRGRKDARSDPHALNNNVLSARAKFTSIVTSGNSPHHSITPLGVERLRDARAYGAA